MRYIIGCKLAEHDKIYDGVLVVGEYGGSYVYMPGDNIHKETRVHVFYTLDDIKAYIKDLNEECKRKFDIRASRYNVDRDCFRLFPLKYDSSKCPILITEQLERTFYKGKSYKAYYFKAKNMRASEGGTL